MARSIRDYVSEGADISYEKLTARFGEPKQIASTYVMEMEVEELLEGIKNSKKIFRLVVTALVTFVILWAGIVTVSYFDHHRNMNGYAVVDEIQIVNEMIYEGEN